MDRKDLVKLVITREHSFGGFQGAKPVIFPAGAEFIPAPFERAMDEARTFFSKIANFRVESGQEVLGRFADDSTEYLRWVSKKDLKEVYNSVL